MGYDFHIERRPPEGWDAWIEAHTPAKLERQIEAAEKAGKDDLAFDLNEKLQAQLEKEKLALGLSISERDWRTAVGKTTGARMATKRPEYKNPRTGDVISLKFNPNDVEVCDKDGQWHTSILFRRGAGTFSGRAWEPGHPVGLVACQLAQHLKAMVVGDEGEVYPLTPGSHGTIHR
jgi:hypothetical protein